MRKYKTFIANGVYLSKVDDKYRGNNGNCQFSIVIRAQSKKRVAEILGCGYQWLREFAGIHEAGEKHLDIPKKDDTIYFNPGATKSGYYDEWIEYDPSKKTGT